MNTHLLTKNKATGLLTAVILTLIVVACGGGGNDLTYKVMGTASQARVEYKDAKGETQTETVTLPWETSFGIGGEFKFAISVNKESKVGSVTCEVWVNDRRVGGTSGVGLAECTGSFSGDRSSSYTNYRGRYDSAPEDAVTTTTEQDAFMATAAVARETRLAAATATSAATLEPQTVGTPAATIAPITDFERYEHDLDCSVYRQELKLRSFSILYPRGAVVEDCSENPENYVQFGFDPEGDSDDPAFAVAVGRFNLDPPDRATYVSRGNRFLDMLVSQLESQYQAQKINSDPILYQGETLFHSDLSAEIEGATRLLRMVAIPNFDHGQGVLVFAIQKITGTPEEAFPEFDRVTQEIITSFEFPSVEPSIGPITFATGVTEENEPISPASSFPTGTSKVFGIFEYEGVLPGMAFEFAWHLDGEEIYADSVTWDDESVGKTWVNFYNDDGMPAGDYELYLSIDGELLQTGSFVIEDDSASEMDATNWYEQGAEYAGQGDYEKALAAFSKAIELDPDYASAYNSRGVIYDIQGDYERALADYDRAIEADPSYVRAYFNRALVYAAQDEFERAVADYDQAIELDSDYAKAYVGRGNVYYTLGELERAAADYDRAIELDPGYVDAYYNRGKVYDIQDDYERAIADYSRVIELAPDYAKVYDNRGTVYYSQKEFDLAIADYDRAIELDPNYARFYLNRGVVYHAKKELDRAIDDYGRAIELDPDYSLAYLNRGFAYADQGDTDNAIADFHKVLEISEDPAQRQTAEEQLQALEAGP